MSVVFKVFSVQLEDIEIPDVNLYLIIVIVV